MSLFLSYFTLFHLSIVLGPFLSVSMFHFSVTYFCFCVFAITSYSFVSVCLSPSLLSSYPIPTPREWTQGVQKKKKWTRGTLTPRCPRAKDKHPALCCNLDTGVQASRSLDPSLPQAPRLPSPSCGWKRQTPPALSGPAPCPQLCLSPPHSLPLFLLIPLIPAPPPSPLPHFCRTLIG